MARLLIATLGLGVASGFLMAGSSPGRHASPRMSATGRTLADFSVKSLDGRMASLDNYNGQVALVVNVASK